MSFPKNFIFGCSTASYQIEGSWNADGKGENIWDRITHSNPCYVDNRENGDKACDSYNLFKSDVQLIKNIGFNMYRFSISWTRILPDGDITNINQAGIGYYHNLIDELLNNDIQPMITMYHWDLPQKLQDFGGWMNPMIIDYMYDYADLLFSLYGDKVKWWITINEPIKVVEGYELETFAPALNLDSPANYIVAHHVLIAHGEIFKLYSDKYRFKQQGKISISFNAQYFTEKTNSEEDVEAARRGLIFELGWVAHPIFSKEGDYPKLMKDIIDENSRKEGRNRSRLPEFTAEEINLLRGSFDFFSLNHYTTRFTSVRKYPTSRTYYQDMNAQFERSPDYPVEKGHWVSVVPWGFRKILCWIKEQYDNPPIFITENGYSDFGDSNDENRVNYYKELPGRKTYYRYSSTYEYYNIQPTTKCIFNSSDSSEKGRRYSSTYEYYNIQPTTKCIFNSSDSSEKGREYIKEMYNAMEEQNCNVIGYMVWSLMDNFEWKNGYRLRFGIVHVDFDDPKRKRTLKKSAKFFKKFLETRTIL